MDPKTDEKISGPSDKNFYMETNIKAVVRNLEKCFKEADKDGRGGLDVQEFSRAMRSIYPTYSEEELMALHIQMDGNCDGKVDFNELLNFEISKIIARQKLNFNKILFPLKMKTVEVNYHNKIVKIIARPMDRNAEFRYREVGAPQKYVEEEYISVSSDGVLNFWTNRFDKRTMGSVYTKTDALPYSHKHRIHVNDMVYIKEREEVAVATNERELRFYIWSFSMLEMKYSIITEGGRITALNYWSDGKRAIFSFGDAKGFFNVFVSYNVKENGLFNRRAFERTQLERYNRVYISTLLKNTSKDFLAVTMPIFSEACSLIKFFPSIEEFAICGQSSTKMVLAALPKSASEKIIKKEFENPTSKKIFTCVEYCVETQYIVTGGTDGILRTWLAHKPDLCKWQFTGPSSAIIYLLHNPGKRIIICLHEDQTICVWSLEDKDCVQTLKAEGMGPNSISGVYYSLQNNELVLANTKIGIYLGKGTDVCKDMLSSHVKPLCGAIYHNIFNQVISVCQNGTVTVWDVRTGETLMQFNVSPYKLAAFTAIALNEPNNKLITVCNDGKVRFWNFNNGQELEVLPVTVPTVATGIMCTKERVFVTGKESCIIYNLDLDNKAPVYLEHPSLKYGISSVAIHPTDRKIMTASKNGIVIVWDIETCHAKYCINGNESPKIHHIFQKECMGKIGNLPVDKETHKVDNYEQIPVPKKLLRKASETVPPSEVFNSPLLLCLKSREVDFDRVTLLIAEGRNISAWSVKAKGGLLGKFNVTNDKDTQITCIESDPGDKILMAGDNRGYVYVWNILTYGDRKCGFKEPFEEINNWKVSLCPPPRLNMWKAHNGPVTSVNCNPSCDNFITTGWDCNVHLWTKNQRRVGTFGKDQWEGEQLKHDWVPQAKKLARTSYATEEEWTRKGPKQLQTSNFSRRWPQRQINIDPHKQEILKSLHDMYWDMETEALNEERERLTAKPSKKMPCEKKKCHHKEKQKPFKKPRHFLEKKQFHETLLLYNPKCPENPYLVDEEVLASLKLTLGSKHSWSVPDVTSSLHDTFHKKRTVVKPAPPSNKTKVLSLKTQTAYKEEYERYKKVKAALSLAPDDAGLTARSVKQSSTEGVSAATKATATDHLELEDNVTPFVPAPPSDKKGNATATQATSLVRSAKPYLSAAVLKSNREDNAMPFVPAPPSDKKGFSAASQARFKTMYRRQQEKTSLPRSKKNSLPSAADEENFQPVWTRYKHMKVLSHIDADSKGKHQIQVANGIDKGSSLTSETTCKIPQTGGTSQVPKLPLITAQAKGTTTRLPIPGAQPKDKKTLFKEQWTGNDLQAPHLPTIQPPLTVTKEVSLQSKHFIAILPRKPENRGVTSLPPVPGAQSKEERTSVRPHLAHQTTFEKTRSCYNSPIPHFPPIRPPLMPRKEESFKASLRAKHSVAIPLSKPENRGMTSLPPIPRVQCRDHRPSLTPQTKSEELRSRQNSQVPHLPLSRPPLMPRKEESFKASLRAKHSIAIPLGKPQNRGATILPAITGVQFKDNRISLAHPLPLIAPQPKLKNEAFNSTKHSTVIRPSKSDQVRSKASLPLNHHALPSITGTSLKNPQKQMWTVPKRLLE